MTTRRRNYGERVPQTVPPSRRRNGGEVTPERQGGLFGRLRREKNQVVQSTIRGESRLARGSLLGGNAQVDLRSREAHGRSFNFGSRIVSGNTSVGELTDATRFAAIRGRTDAAMTSDLGRLNWGILTDLDKIFNSTTNIEKAANKVGERYGPEARKIMMQSLTNIRQKSGGQDLNRGRFGRALLGVAKPNVGGYMGNLDDFDKLARMNRQEGVAGLVAHALVGAIGKGVPITVPLPIVVNRVPAPGQEYFPGSEKIAPAIQRFAAGTRGELFSRGKYNQSVTRAGNELLSEQRYRTQARIRNALPVRGFFMSIANFDGELGGLNRKVHKYTDLVRAGQGNTPEALLLAGQIDERHRDLKGALDRRAKHDTQYGDANIALGEIEKQMSLFRNVRARTAERISEDAGVMAYYGKELTDDLRLSKNKNLIALANDIDRFNRTGDTAALARAQGNPDFQKMRHSFELGPQARLAWMQQNLLGPQTNVRTRRGAYGPSIDTFSHQGSEQQRYIDAVMGTTNINGRPTNIGIAGLNILQNSLGDGRNNDVFLHDLVEGMRKGRVIQNGFAPIRSGERGGPNGLNSSLQPLGSNGRFGNRWVSLGRGLSFPMRAWQSGTDVEVGAHWKGDCLNFCVTKKPFVYNSDKGGSIAQYASATWVAGGGSGGSSNGGGSGPNVTSGTGFGSSGIVPSL